MCAHDGKHEEDHADSCQHHSLMVDCGVTAFEVTIAPCLGQMPVTPRSVCGPTAALITKAVRPAIQHLSHKLAKSSFTLLNCRSSDFANANFK